MTVTRVQLTVFMLLTMARIGAADESTVPVFNLTSINTTAPVSPESSAVPLTSGSPKLFGLIAQSDHGFSDFISPMTNPVYFEDPRTLTEVRPIFVNHTIPNALGGGSAQLIAMQARAALTENLSIIATKDGFFFSQNGLMSDGFADVNAGLKYNIYKDYCSQTIVSTGFTYGIPLGSHQALQGKGNGEFNLFLTGGQQLGDNWHLVSTFGARLPANTDVQTQSTYLSSHLDRKLGNSGFYLFTEANWYHWLSSSNSFAAPVEGLDLFNLGSVGVAGNDIVTGGYGVKYKPNKNLELGVAYEIPYTDRRDIIQNRLTVDLILRY
ncbi:hypothetical protein [Schlesneria paludicola]|uniref:hypothetical protein n=1 Tax=Schlesneria paludicola TaxID=360056 RepID=UPI00029AC6DF|nr:hypothetical protein [Schlesneria paludicola]